MSFINPAQAAHLAQNAPSFELIPEGDYVLELKSAQVCKSQKGNLKVECEWVDPTNAESKFNPKTHTVLANADGSIPTYPSYGRKLAAFYSMLPADLVATITDIETLKTALKKLPRDFTAIVTCTHEENTAPDAKRDKVARWEIKGPSQQTLASAPIGMVSITNTPTPVAASPVAPNIAPDL